MHSDGTLTAPFFVMPESMLSASTGSGSPFSQLYVIVNSKLGPEFSMPDRNISRRARPLDRGRARRARCARNSC